MSDPLNVSSRMPKHIGIAADHGGYRLKEGLVRLLRDATYEVIDFGNFQLKTDDDYPDFVAPLAQAVARKEIDRGVAICGSGVGACIIANKVPGVRACLIHEKFSARQGVEDDDMNVICLGSKALDKALAWELVTIFLTAQFSGAERHRRRIAKIVALEGRMEPNFMPSEQQINFSHLKTNISDSIKRLCQSPDAVIYQIADEVKNIQTTTVEPGVEIVQGLATIIDGTIKNSVRLGCDTSSIIKGIFVGAFRSNVSVRREAHKTINLLVNEIALSVLKHKADVKQMVDGLLSASTLVAREQKLNEPELRLVVLRDTLISAEKINPGFFEKIKAHIPKEYEESIKERNKESRNA